MANLIAVLFLLIFNVFFLTKMLNYASILANALYKTIYIQSAVFLYSYGKVTVVSFNFCQFFSFLKCQLIFFFLNLKALVINSKSLKRLKRAKH